MIIKTQISDNRWEHKCTGCLRTYVGVENWNHICLEKSKDISCYDIEYNGQTEITKKYKFVCLICGFKHADRKLKKLPHCCKDYICDFEDFETVFKCRNCGIVLEQKEIRLCQEKNGVQGLGDVVAKVAKSVGIKQKKDCGCGNKQKKLNKLIPFK